MERLTATPSLRAQRSNLSASDRLLRRFAPRNDVWIVLAVLLLVAPLFADSPQELFKQGNAAYAQGKFDDAVKAYQAAQDGGLRNWALDYNLGNAYYKAGQLGRAVLNYERAFRLNSGDRDVLYNLALATTKAGDPELPTSALPALLWRFFFFLSLNTLTVLVSLLTLALGAWAILALLGRPFGRFDWAVPPLFGLFVLGFWLGARIAFSSRPQAVILSSVAEVRSGPNMSYPANFTVPEGHRVLVLDEQEPVTGWVEIGVPEQGLKGWAPTSSVEPI